MERSPIALANEIRRGTWWETIEFPSTSVGGGATAPTYDTTYVGWNFSHNPPSNQEIQAYGKAPRHYREGSDFHITIHWYLLSDGAANEDVKWDVLYRGIAGGGTWPVAWTTLEQTVDVSGYVTREDILTEFTTISGAGFDVNAQMDFRLQRDTADAADDFPHDVILKALEVHYQRDAIGSFSHDSKWGV